ncbi:camp-dependent protein kinase catalytic subunit, partial [Rhizoclosmatium hyalinum]
TTVRIGPATGAKKVSPATIAAKEVLEEAVAAALSTSSVDIPTVITPAKTEDSVAIPVAPVVVEEVVTEKVEVTSIAVVNEEQDVVSSVVEDVAATKPVDQIQEGVSVELISVPAIEASAMEVDVAGKVTEETVVLQDTVEIVDIPVPVVEEPVVIKTDDVMPAETVVVPEPFVDKMDVLVEEEEPEEEVKTVVVETVPVIEESVSVPSIITDDVMPAESVTIPEPFVDKMEVLMEEDEDDVAVDVPAPAADVTVSADVSNVDTVPRVEEKSGLGLRMDALMEEDEEDESDTPRVDVVRPSNDRMMNDESMDLSDSTGVPEERVSLQELMVDQQKAEEQTIPVERVSLQDLMEEDEEMTEQTVPVPSTSSLDHFLTERHVPVERITLEQLMTSHEIMSTTSSGMTSANTEMMLTPTPPTPPPAIPSITDCKPFFIQDFKLVRTVGTGSFGRVHLAHHVASNTYVALKVLRKHDVVKLKQVEHTLDEKRILEALSNGCPFLVHLYGSFMDNEHLYLVLEYIQGGELFTYLRNMDKLDNEAAKFYAAEVVLAFEYLHSADVVYRDL